METIKATGMGLVKVDQSGWQEMARYRLAGLDLEASTSKTGELAHRKLECLGAIDQGVRLVEQQLPSFGHDNAASHTMEQFRANSRSSHAIAARHRGKSKSKGVGRARDAFALGNGDKDLQIDQASCRRLLGRWCLGLSTGHHMNSGRLG
jgi:hypothetical protein